MPVVEPMNVAERNKRLYKKLRDMGLYVAIMSDPDNHEIIDSITVSAGKPKITLVPFDVRFPLEGSEVRELVRPALRNGNNVVEFPSVD